LPDRDVVLAKVATIQKCLGRILDVTRLDPECLEDIDKQDIFVLNLQRAIQACIDLAAYKDIEEFCFILLRLWGFIMVDPKNWEFSLFSRGCVRGPFRIFV